MEPIRSPWFRSWLKSLHRRRRFPGESFRELRPSRGCWGRPQLQSGRLGHGPRPVQRRTSRMVPNSAAPNTANGAIHATRLKPCVVGAASTVTPYLVVNQSRICLSVCPVAMAALSSSSIGSDVGTAHVVALAQHLRATAGAHQAWPRSVKRDPHRLRRARSRRPRPGTGPAPP